MAKAAWLTVEPQSGQGNATVQNTGTVHTGRVQRTTTVTGVATGVEAAKSYQVSQEPKPVFLSVNTKTFSVGENSTTITVSGTSNATSIGLSAVSGSSITFTFPDTVKVNSTAVTTGSAIPNDPGASAQYSWSAVVTVPKNTVGQRTGKFNVTANGCSPVEVTVTQATSTYDVVYSKGSYVNTISRTSQVVNYGGTATCTATLPANTAQYTYSFDGWYEGSTRISTSLALSVENIKSDRTFTATGKRTLNRYTMTVTVTPTGGGTVSGSGTYDYGSSVTLTATPSTGYDFVKFVNEEGNEYTANPSSGWQITKNRTVQAVFELKKYTVTLSAQYRVNESGDYTSGTTGGTVSGGGTYTHGSSVTAKATPTTGYEFDGWYSGTSLQSSSASYQFTATGNKTLTARFQRKWFTVTFAAGKGGTVSPTSQRVQYGGSASSKATPSTGYNFTKWSNGETDTTITVSNVTAAATYTATFTIKSFTVTYAKSTGIASVSRASETVNYGATAQGSTATLTTGYNFSGWYNASGNQVSTSLTYKPANVTASATYTAKASIKTFVVTGTAQYRDTDSTGSFTTGTTGGIVKGGGTYDYGDEVTLTAEAKTGYRFSGWYNSGGEQLSTSASYVINSVTAAVTVYARFQKRWYTVTFAKGTGVNTLSSSSTRVAYNGTVKSPTATAATGYNSPTWTLTSGTASISVASGVATLTGVKSNVTITASATINKYTISYSKNANVASISKTSETVTYGGTATCTAKLPATTAQYTYSFSGWYEGSSKISSNLALSVSNISANRSFEARGTATTRQYTITVVNGSGSGTYDYGTEVTITASTITGKTFTGWSDGVTTASRQITVTANATYTAEYKVNTYTISYTKGTGIASVSRASETVEYGDTALGSTATVSTGYNFSGWYNSGGSRVSTSATYAPTNVTANATYQARATIKTFTVTVNAYYRTTDGTGNYTSGTTGGTVSGGGTVNYGSDKKVTASAATGYTFDGWYSAGASGGSLLSSSASYTITDITANKTVYARFTKKYYTITYVKGDYINTISRTSERVAHGGNASGSTATAMTTTAQYSYSLSGWYNASGSRVTTAAAYAPTNVTAAATYTAKATRTLRSYTISVSANPSDRATVSGGGTYDYGDTVTVSCTKKNSADAFVGWYKGDELVSSSAEYTFEVSTAVTLVAKVNYLDVSPTTLEYDNSASNKTFTVSSNVNWELS